MIHEQSFVISTSEMLGKLPFYRGAKRRKMKENEGNEGKWGKENGGIVCKFCDKLFCHMFFGTGTVGLFAASDFGHLLI